MKVFNILILIAIPVVAIRIWQMFHIESFQKKVPDDIVKLDQQILTLTNTLMTTMRTYGTLLNRRKDLEANYIKTGGKPVAYPDNVITFMKFIRPI